MCVSGGLYTRTWTGIMGQRGPCGSGTSSWSQGGNIHWYVVTRKYQARPASKLDKSLGSYIFGPEKILEKREGLLVGYWRDQEVQVSYWRCCWYNQEIHLRVCAHIRQMEKRRSKDLWLGRQSVWLGGVTGRILCVCVHMHANWAFFQELEWGCKSQWLTCQDTSNGGERRYRDRLNV